MPQLGSLEKALRVGEGRRLKRLREQADYIMSLEPDFESLSDDELAGKTVEFKQRIENGEDVDELVFETFAAVREAFKRTMGVHLFPVQADGRDRSPRGRYRGDEDGRGEDVRRQPAAVPERADRQQRPPGHGQRLPGQARRELGRTGLREARDALGLHREHDGAGGPRRRLRGRHHVRDELRVRLRLPPRQHGRLPRRDGAAGPLLRDRGRGRLDPDRRGAGRL